MPRQTALTGVRPTGPLHLGHYAGALENWVRLQEAYECFFLIADYQVSDYSGDIALVRESVREVALDWLAVGLDPEKSHFVVESLVPEHAELTVLLSWFVPLGRLQRNPTLKAEMEDLDRGAKGVPVGFFIYPVMQVANILLPRAHLVPVGEDQLPHIEMTRELARRFNRDHGLVFVEPEALVGRVPRLVGIDGRAKMSKSLGNAIYLKDDAATVGASYHRITARHPGRFLLGLGIGHPEATREYQRPYAALVSYLDQLDDLKVPVEGRVLGEVLERSEAAERAGARAPGRPRVQ